MKFLITIHSDSELINYEAVALGFTLASFDHQVQFYFTGNSHLVLNDPQSRIYGMIQSLALYDLPKAWVKFEQKICPDEMIGDVTMPIDVVNVANFDSTLVF